MWISIWFFIIISKETQSTKMNFSKIILAALLSLAFVATEQQDLSQATLNAQIL